jgi:uncharacterized protein YgbK (DUF1537 family)
MPMVAIGGDTSKAVARALSVKSIELVREVAPGIPLCMLRGAQFQVPVAAKAGGFGSARALVDCVDALTGDRA